MTGKITRDDIYDYLRKNLRAERMRITRKNHKGYRDIYAYGPLPTRQHITGWYIVGDYDATVERIENGR